MRRHLRSTLFPYTTLFRSYERGVGERKEQIRPDPDTVAKLDLFGVRDRGDVAEPHRFQIASHAVIAVFRDRKSTRLNSSHMSISYAVFCLKKKTQTTKHHR